MSVSKFIGGMLAGMGLTQLTTLLDAVLGRLDAETVTAALSTEVVKATASTYKAVAAVPGPLTAVYYYTTTTAASALGTITGTVHVNGVTVLAGATFDLEVIAGGGIASLPLAAVPPTIAEGDLVEVEITSDNADAVGGGDARVWLAVTPVAL